MKKLLIGAGVLVVVAAVGIFVLVSNLDSVIKQAIETVGPKVTQADVTVEEVTLDLADGAAEIRGLHLGNPAGFQTKRAMNLGLVSVRIDTDTVTSDEIVIHEVVIDAPQMTYEVGDPRSNFQRLQQNVEDFIARNAGGTGESGGGQESETADGSAQPKLIIENLYVRNAEVGVSAPFLQGRDVGTRIPEIHLTGIGQGSGGATPAEVAALALDAITERVIGAVGKLDLKGMMDGAAGALREGAEGALKDGDAGKAVEDAGKAVEEGLGGALKGLTGD
jgi:hypothetical protein